MKLIHINALIDLHGAHCRSVLLSNARPYIYTHVHHLLGAMAIVAYQSMIPSDIHTAIHL